MLYLTAGHQIINGKGNGAFGVGGFDEAVEARKLVDDLILDLKGRHKISVVTDHDSWSLQFLVDYLKSKVTMADTCIEIHFNAGPATASGTEVLIPDTNTVKEQSFAKELVNTIARVLAIKSRGVKTEKDSAHGKLAFLRQPALATNLLIEICFISNGADVAAYRANYNNLVGLLSNTIAANLKK